MSFPPVPGLAENVERAISKLEHDRVIDRVWKRDRRAWVAPIDDGTDKLGWLDAPWEMSHHIHPLIALGEQVAADGIDTIVICGMGGSSLGASLIAATLGAPGITVEVLDTTHPETVRDLSNRVLSARSLFVIASKSGTTIETRSHFEHFWAALPDGSRYVAVTDPGTPLEAMGRERGFRSVFLNPHNIGGRFSGISLFGLVPAALARCDIAGFLAGAQDMATRCRDTDAGANPGAMLGAVLGAGETSHRDKLFIDDTVAAPYFPWIEQLIAESLGKQHRGLVPCEGRAAASVPDDSVLPIAIVEDGAQTQSDAVQIAASAGAHGLGAELFRWEFATAVAGHLVGVYPFDQPDVEAAKSGARKTLQSGKVLAAAEWGSAAEALADHGTRDYVALQAFLPETEANEALLQAAADRLSSRYGLPVTANFGPRYLHSTGQLHKGGPPTAICIQIVDDVAEDLPIPHAGFSFGQLIRAQADGDFRAIRERGRRVCRLRPDELSGL